MNHKLFYMPTSTSIMQYYAVFKLSNRELCETTAEAFANTKYILHNIKYVHNPHAYNVSQIHDSLQSAKSKQGCGQKIRTK